MTWSTHYSYISISLNNHLILTAHPLIKSVRWIWLDQPISDTWAPAWMIIRRFEPTSLSNWSNGFDLFNSIEIHQCQFEWSFHAYSKCLDQISQMNLTSSTHSCYTSISYNDHITPKAHPFIDLTWWTLFWDISINLNDHLMRKAHSIIKSFSRCIYIDQLISVTLASVCTNHLMSITNTWIKSNQINK